MQSNHLLKVLLVVALFQVLACSKNETKPVIPSYLITNEDQSMGIISSFKPGSKSSEQSFILPLRQFPERISDVVRLGDKLFIARNGSATVEVVDTSSWTILQSLSYAAVFSGNTHKHIVVTDSRIFVSDRAYLNDVDPDNESFIKVIHRDQPSVVDSIAIVANGPIWALAKSKNRLFVSVMGSANSIIVLDISTYSIIDEIPLTSLCNNMVIDKDENILAFSGGHVIRIDVNDLSILDDEAIGGSTLNVFGEYATNSTGYSLDKTSNIIYYLRTAAQPAPAPYYLSAYDLNTKTTSRLMPGFTDGSTMAFDEVNHLILIGLPVVSSGSGLTTGEISTYDINGKFIETFTVPGVPSQIDIKP